MKQPKDPLDWFADESNVGKVRTARGIEIVYDCERHCLHLFGGFFRIQWHESVTIETISLYYYSGQLPSPDGVCDPHWTPLASTFYEGESAAYMMIAHYIDFASWVAKLINERVGRQVAITTAADKGEQ